jgi:hypothetical protein
MYDLRLNASQIESFSRKNTKTEEQSKVETLIYEIKSQCINLAVFYEAFMIWPAFCQIVSLFWQ